MPKIRVSDIAKKMGVPEQDLLFKLKSIGVRVEGEQGLVDMELIKALLQGKQLPQAPQREVILRDPQAQADQPAPTRRPPSSTRRPGPAPRPAPRRRGIVNKDQKIRTLPSSTPARREPPASKPPPEAPRRTEAKPAARTETRGPAKAPRGKSRAERLTELKQSEDLSDFRGDVSELEDAQRSQPLKKITLPTAPSPGRRQRRETRRRESAAASQKGGIVSSKDTEAEGTIMISEGIRVRELAEKLGVKSKDLITHLMKQGVMATINHTLETDTAVKIAEELGFDAMTVSFEEEVQLLQEERFKTEGNEVRPAVVTVMGHVDHGKTTLLDTIRSANVTEGEHGGITQHIAAYQVEHNGKRVTFLDTPGHEAFTALRARGAKVTDVVVLVVAADDGVMPQTREAINHAKAADVPIIVAMNKMDKADANPDKVKKELSENELLVEDWGGDVVSIPISALKGDGVEDLLEMIQINAEILELKGRPRVTRAGAAIIEASKEVGRGTVATVLVQNGTLSVGDIFVAGFHLGPSANPRRSPRRAHQVRRSFHPGRSLRLPGFYLRRVTPSRWSNKKPRPARSPSSAPKSSASVSLAPLSGRLSLESLFAKLEEGEVKELPVVLKADVQGSLEVLKETLTKSSTDKVKVNVIHTAIGGITTHDVLLASASGAIIYGFNVRPEKRARDLASKEDVDIRTHTIHLRDGGRAEEGHDRPARSDLPRSGQGAVPKCARSSRYRGSAMIAGCHSDRRRDPKKRRDSVVARQRGHPRGQDRIFAALQRRRRRGA